MITAMFRRVRIDRFAALLDETTARGGRHQALSTAGKEADDGLAELVGVSRQLEVLGPLAAPRPEFRVSTRAKLLRRAAEELGAGAAIERTVPLVPDERTVRLSTGAGLAPLDAVRGRLGTTRTRAALLAGVAAGAVALSGMSTASGGAMPGDALYGVKRSTEKAQLALAGSDLGRGQLYLEFARTRLAEAGAVRNDPQAFSDVLDDMDGETLLGVRLLTTAAVGQHDTAALGRVGVFADNQTHDLGGLSKDLTAPVAKEAAARSTSVLWDVRKRVHDLSAKLPCLGDQPPTDDLGPQPVCATGAPK